MKRDAMRITLMSVLAATLLLWLGNGLGDSSWRVVAFSAGAVLLVAGLSHITRRVLFHRIDIQDFAIKAAETPIGAAISFAAVVYFLTVLVQSGVALMR